MAVFVSDAFFIGGFWVGREVRWKVDDLNENKREFDARMRLE